MWRTPSRAMLDLHSDLVSAVVEVKCQRVTCYYLVPREEFRRLGVSDIPADLPFLRMVLPARASP